MPHYSLFPHSKDVSCEECHGSFITGESAMGVTGRVYAKGKGGLGGRVADVPL